jgi:hypothetical protein
MRKSTNYPMTQRNDVDVLLVFLSIKPFARLKEWTEYSNGTENDFNQGLQALKDRGYITQGNAVKKEVKDFFWKELDGLYGTKKVDALIEKYFLTELEKALT